MFVSQVDWYEWGTEAFDKAKRENKPIFLSVRNIILHLFHGQPHVTCIRSDIRLATVRTSKIVFWATMLNEARVSRSCPRKLRGRRNSQANERELCEY